MPGVKFGELVGAEEEGEAVGGVFVAEGFDGVDGVAGFAFALAAVEFAGVGEEEGVVGDGGVEHGEAVFGGCACSMGFVGGDVGGDEEDAVGVEDFAGALAGDEVAVVDGVEGSAVEEYVCHGERPTLNTKTRRARRTTKIIGVGSRFEIMDLDRKAEPPCKIIDCIAEVL